MEDNRTSSFDIYVNDLPDEVLVRCFSYLAGEDLLSVSETCILWYAISCDNEAWKSAFLKTYGNKKIAMKKEYRKCEQREQAAQIWLTRLTPRPARTTSAPVVNSALITRALEQHAADLELRRKKRHNPNGGPKWR